MKFCRICKLEKDDFYPDKRRKDGLRAECIGCCKISAAEFHRRNARAANGRARNWRKYNREAVKENNRKFSFKRYGLTEQDYEVMLAKQGGGCAICSTDIPGGCGRFCIDHDHKTGQVRGLLCSSCNIGIGNLKDSVVLLQKAALYLQASVNGK